MAELDTVRDWVGSNPDDGDVLEALDRFGGDPLLAARSILQRRLADMEGGYSSFQVDGDASWQILATQLTNLRDKIAGLDALISDVDPDGPFVVSSVPITAPPAPR